MKKLPKSIVNLFNYFIIFLVKFLAYFQLYIVKIN